jgi:hypothetical protein
MENMTICFSNDLVYNPAGGWVLPGRAVAVHHPLGREPLHRPAPGPRRRTRGRCQL